MKDNERRFYISIPVNFTGNPGQPSGYETVEVTEEQYRAYYRPIWRTRDHAKRHGGCCCSDWRRCSGDCGLCKYRTNSDVRSLDQMREAVGDAVEYRDDACTDEIASPVDEYDRLLDGIVYDTIADRIKALSVEERSICECILLDLTEREAAERLGVSKSTYHDRKEKLFKHLRTDWKDLL